MPSLGCVAAALVGDHREHSLHAAAEPPLKWVITENTRAADEPPLDDHREHSLHAATERSQGTLVAGHPMHDATGRSDPLRRYSDPLRRRWEIRLAACRC